VVSGIEQQVEDRGLGTGRNQFYSAGLRAGWSEVRVPAGAGNFSLHHRVQTGSGAHPPPIQWVSGALSLEVKRSGRKADHSLPSSAEVKNAWSYTFTPPIHLHGMALGQKKRTGTTLPLLFTLFVPFVLTVWFWWKRNLAKTY
jgi:hypothetical protein